MRIVIGLRAGITEVWLSTYGRWETFCLLKPPDTSGTHPVHIQWVMDHVSPGINRPGPEADHSNPPSAEATNVWHNTFTLSYAFIVFIWTISVSTVIRLPAGGSEIWLSIYGRGEIMVFILTTWRLPVTYPHIILRRSKHVRCCINTLNTKRRLLYLKTQFVPRSKHFSSRL